MTDVKEHPTGHPEATVIDSVQSLIVAFVLAMTFRGFVTEGFVIPTGSMAPTLMGQHVLLHSEQTGVEFPVGVDTKGPVPPLNSVPDPMLGRYCTGSAAPSERPAKRMGDRILVLKSLYSFSEPHRFDVVVFKNPTDPVGDSANYIKRLIGLPDEQIWLADGDVFAAPNGDDVSIDEFAIQRKPEHIQRSIWQPVHHSDFVPQKPDRLRQRFRGSPWQGGQWNTDGRVYATTITEPSSLTWDGGVRELNDWTSYDFVSTPLSRQFFAISDLRVGAGVVADRPEALEMTFELQARGFIFEFAIRGADAGGHAQVRWAPADRSDEPDAWITAEPVEIDLPGPGEVFNVEFWHADQSLSIYLDDDRVVHETYDWTAPKRMGLATGGSWKPGTTALRDYAPLVPQLQLRFSGSPLQLHRVRTDRDIYYRPDRLTSTKSRENPPMPEFDAAVEYGSPAAGTHPDKTAVLGPDHFFMLGDNSQASLDSRLWGAPHPLVATQVDPHPFIVHRRLIIGKAWVVYFPAPFFAGRQQMPVIPDFGRLRFIR